MATTLQAAKDAQPGPAEIQHDKAGPEKHSSSSCTESCLHDLDNADDELIYPTDEEKEQLRRVSDTLPWGAYRKQISVCYSSYLCTCVS